ncbi:hypothetical protein RB608_24815 [Nocardioides sp. LHD-245]|uniref:hypothetical protein n=1 Tax=Nocardioides sp. LHD-245 TaxID=3051387 RepID=UPI0027E100FE|nr:hypothetical protein [Nocardioides sp. LHD-245]
MTTDNPIGVTKEQATTCPDWCTSDHDEGPPFGYHWGPEFGGIKVTWSPLDPAVAPEREWAAHLDLLHYWEGFGTDDTLTAPELRSLAVDASAAAEWLEAHQ